MLVSFDLSALQQLLLMSFEILYNQIAGSPKTKLNVEFGWKFLVDLYRLFTRSLSVNCSIQTLMHNTYHRGSFIVLVQPV